MDKLRNTSKGLPLTGPNSPAFPPHGISGGMTKREYAIIAITAAIIPDALRQTSDNRTDIIWSEDDIVDQANRIVDKLFGL